jgi:CheY-like chemotaxis protein
MRLIPIGTDATDGAAALNKFRFHGLSCGISETEMAPFMTLLVEDDTLQREYLADLLKEKGLEVVECTTAEAAELVLATAGLELRALVTDVHLDGVMTGIELAEFAKQKYPQLNVLVISGREQPALPPDTRFFAKPYAPDDIVSAILS